jgi:hypothetical protein
MVQEFMTTLSKYIQTLDDNVVMHTTTIEELAYHRLFSLYDQLEILGSLPPGQESIKGQNSKFKITITCSLFCLF